MNTSNLLIIIPARGGSKGLPGKNTKILGSYPLLKWTTDAIALSGVKDYQCVLSTDDQEIAAIGDGLGLEIPFIRPTELATDISSGIDVVNHAIEWFENERNFFAEYVIVLQPTSPFRPPHIIHEAYSLLQEGTTDAVTGVKLIHRNLRTLFRTDKLHNLTPVDKEAELITRRQEVPTLYTPNGAMYGINVASLKKHKTFFPQSTKPIIMDQVQSHDIDNPLDWDIATAYVNAGLTWRSDKAGAPV